MPAKMVTDRGLVVSLTKPQREVMLMLGQRGGEQTMDSSKFPPVAIQALEDLKSMNLITITELIGRSAKVFAITDYGRQVIDQIHKQMEGKDEVPKM